MFSPFRKRPDGLLDGVPSERKPKKPMTREVKRRLWATVALSVILLIIWYGCMALGNYFHKDTLIFGVMVVYFLAFAALLITYIAYNRAFVNKDVTVDMLPPEWSNEKKQKFVDDTRARAEKSRWMVTVIIPFAVVFMTEFLYLYVWEGWLSGLIGGIG